MSVDVLIGKIQEKNNPTCVGLDPDVSKIPAFLREKSYKEYGENLMGAADAIWEFNKGLIDALYDVVPAIKPQSAYYEMLGPWGVMMLEKTIRYAKEKGLYVIADVKRNDIGSTAECYAKAYLGEAFGADSATVNGYLGTDGIEPFLKQCRTGKMIFVLVKTSNPSSGELQDRLIDGKTVYETMAGMVNTWGETAMGEGAYSQVGAVVGATYPEQLCALRKVMPKAFFLVPGYGAQGGKGADIVGAFNEDKLGAVINSSRGIMYAYKKAGLDEKAYAEAARAEAIRMRDEICSFL